MVSYIILKLRLLVNYLNRNLLKIIIGIQFLCLIGLVYIHNANPCAVELDTYILDNLKLSKEKLRLEIVLNSWVETQSLDSIGH